MREPRPHDEPLPEAHGMAHLATLADQIASCRPRNVDDLELPEMAALAEALEHSARVRRQFDDAQCFDAMLAEHLQDIAAPAGLAERLLSHARDAVAPEVANPGASVAAASQIADMPAPRASTGRYTSRRRWFVAGGAALAASAAWVCLQWFLHQPPAEIYDPGRVMELLRAYHEQPAAGAWRPLAAGNPPRELGFSSQLVGDGATLRWRALARPFLERQGLAYEFAAPGRPRIKATLYVLHVSGGPRAPMLQGFTSGPALDRALVTGGFASVAWVETDRLYVLVVPGDERGLVPFLTPRGAEA